jgi:alkylated DNA repair dioxygenase AlkB
VTAAITLNPRLRLDGARAGAGAVQVQWPDPDAGLQTATVRAADEPELCEVLRAMIAASAGGQGLDADVSDQVWQRLVELNVLVAPDRIVPPVRFRCGLPAAPGPGDEPPAPDGELVPNPTARLIADAARLGPAHAAAMAAGPLVVFDPPGGLRDYLWLDRDGGAAVRALCAGERAPAGLPAALRDRLRRVGLLVPRSAPGADEGQGRHAGARDHLRARDLAILPGLVPRHRREALRAYYRALVAHGYATRERTAASHRFAIHREPLAEALHRDLVPVVNDLAGRAMAPSYSYFASYVPGTTLTRHVDREQSELAALIAIEGTPLVDGATWPFHLAHPDGEITTLRLEPGDVLLFRGRRLPHWRDPLPEGATWSSLLMFFVDDDFAGPLD